MPAGRPTDFKEEYVEKAKKLSLLGYNDKQLAAYFDVSESTLNLWKKKHPKFSESLKSGKDDADGEIVKSLYDKAVSGDTTAMIFWLKNRQRYSWRDKHDHELSTDKENPVKFEINFVKERKGE